MPEGLAVGVGFGAAAGDPAQLGSALSLMLAIGLQNIPGTHRSGHERVATLGLMAGVIITLYLDIALAG